MSSVSFESFERLEQQASAEPKPKAKTSSISRCIRYGQTMGSDKQSVDISLRNRCRMPVSCSLQWKVSCDSSDGATEHADVLKLEKGARDSINASAASCGDDGWAINDIEWECEPL